MALQSLCPSFSQTAECQGGGGGVKSSKEQIANLTYTVGEPETDRMFPVVLNFVCTLEPPTEVLKILMCGSPLQDSVIGCGLGIRVTAAVTFENDCI